MVYRDPAVVASPVTFEAGELRVPKTAELPRVCLMCAGTRKLRCRKHTFAWRPLAFLLPFASITLAAGLAARVGRSVDLDVWLCAPCWSRWQNARDVGPFVWILLGAGIIVALTAGLNGYPLAGVLVAVATAVACALLHRAVVARGRPTVAWIYPSGVVALRGVPPAAIDALLRSTKPA